MTVYVTRVFRDDHHRMPWRFMVAGEVSYEHRGQTEEKVEEFRSHQLKWLRERHEVEEVDMQEIDI